MKRRRGGAAWLATALCPAVATASLAAAGSFEVAEVAPGIFVHSGKPIALDAPGHDDIADIGFIVGKRCVAVIDTGGSVRIGRALRSAIKSHSALPVCYVINTHAHVDHVLGNAAFRNSGARFVGHALLAAALMRSRDFFLKNYPSDLDAPPSARAIVPPDRSVALDRDLDLDLGDRHLTLHAWPKAHTDCDLSVFDLKTRTLWTGDLLFVRRTPAVDGSIKGWLQALDMLAQMRVAHVVPGHGEVSEDLAGALAPERRYLKALLVTVRADIARGEPLQEALRDAYPTEKPNWLLWDETHPRNVARAYQELEWE